MDYMFHVFWGAMLAACMWPTYAYSSLKVLRTGETTEELLFRVPCFPASSKMTLVNLQNYCNVAELLLCSRVKNSDHY